MEHLIIAREVEFTTSMLYANQNLSKKNKGIQYVFMVFESENWFLIPLFTIPIITLSKRHCRISSIFDFPSMD